MSIEIDTTPTLCTLLVDAEAVALGRAAAALPGGMGMLVAGFAPPGASAPAHYLNEWNVWRTFFDAFQDVDLFLAVAAHFGASLPRAQAEYLLAHTTVHPGPAAELLEARGLVPFSDGVV